MPTCDDAGVLVRTVGTAGAFAVEKEEARESLRLRGTGKVPLPFSMADAGVPVRGVKVAMAGMIVDNGSDAQRVTSEPVPGYDLTCAEDLTSSSRWSILKSAFDPQRQADDLGCSCLLGPAH